MRNRFSLAILCGLMFLGAGVGFSQAQDEHQDLTPEQEQVWKNYIVPRLPKKFQMHVILSCIPEEGPRQIHLITSAGGAIILRGRYVVTDHHVVKVDREGLLGALRKKGVVCQKVVIGRIHWMMVFRDSIIDSAKGVRFIRVVESVREDYALMRLSRRFPQYSLNLPIADSHTFTPRTQFFMAGEPTGINLAEVRRSGVYSDAALAYSFLDCTCYYATTIFTERGDSGYPIFALGSKGFALAGLSLGYNYSRFDGRHFEHWFSRLDQTLRQIKRRAGLDLRPRHKRLQIVAAH